MYISLQTGENIMTNKDKVTSDRHSKKLGFSDKYSEAFTSGLNKGKGDRQADFWTVDKLIAMSRNLSSAYGVDY